MIEVDGKIHDFQKPYDRDRDAVLNEMGKQVLRIKNEDLADIGKVIDAIMQLTHPQPLYKVERAPLPFFPSLRSREGSPSEAMDRVSPVQESPGRKPPLPLPFFSPLYEVERGVRAKRWTG